MIAVFPSSGDAGALKEAYSSFQIALHLAGHGIPVPGVHGFDESSSIVLFEDLGDQLLYDIVNKDKVERTGDETVGYYIQAAELLADMQVHGSEGFDEGFCWDTPKYDFSVMLEKESHYFRDSFCEKFCGVRNFPDTLEEEFLQLARRISQEPDHYFLHRDFQSRNLMIHDSKVRVIDFQGARYGPLGYDLASLINDPYVSLPVGIKEEIFQCYLDRLSGHIAINQEEFVEGYYYIALQRNLQVLGAYSFLSTDRNKPFFRQFLIPAFMSLSELFEDRFKEEFPTLNALVDDLHGLLMTKLQ